MNTIEVQKEQGILPHRTKADVIAQLRTKIDKYDNLYYRGIKTGLIPDSQYDALKRELKDLCPEDERHTRVGVPYNLEELRTKVEHTIPMGSLDNTDNGISGYQDWYDSMRQAAGVAPGEDIEICASLKVDGSSVGLSYANGKLIRALSRGNGTQGDLITANAMNFQHVSTAIDYDGDLQVRGEAILFKEDFEKLNEGVAPTDRGNPRNDGAGIIGRLNGTESNFIRFLAFNVHNGHDLKTEQEKFEFLASLGFEHVPFQICKSVEEFRAYYDSVFGMRDDLPFEIDGIVVTVNSVALQQKFITSDPKSRLRPKYSRAVKFDIKTNTTKITGVIITVGHTGSVIPTAILETVRIGGVNVSNALLNNWNEIERLGVAIGDTVLVGLAGDIIPRVLSVEKRAESIFKCPTCGFVGNEEEQLSHHISTEKL